MLRLGLSAAQALLLGFMLAPAVAYAAPASAPLDEAQRAGRTEACLPQAGEDFFHDMDNGVALTPDEVQGRNMWLVWTGGDDRFWDRVTKDSLATFDLLKVITSHPSQTYCDGERCDRDSRWRWLGAINEPCFEKPTASRSEAVRPLARRPRRELRARSVRGRERNIRASKSARAATTFKDGSTLPVGSYFGSATGIVGLRLFPNPDFDQAAKDKWDPERYYTDPNYYNDPNLVRPYRVGMACGFCHVGPSPIHPPADPAHPQWADLNSTVGAQYLWMDRVFVYAADRQELPLPAGAFLSAGHDGHIARLDRLHQQSAHHERGLSARSAARRRPSSGARRRSRAAQLLNKQLAGFFDPPDTSWSPRVLKDGSDSVGVLGRAQSRLHQHRPLQRRMDAPLQSVLWRQADHPIRNRDGGSKLRLLARDRGRHAVHGRSSCVKRRPARPAGRTRRAAENT